MASSLFAEFSSGFIIIIIIIIIFVKGLNSGVISKVGWVWSPGWT